AHHQIAHLGVGADEDLGPAGGGAVEDDPGGAFGAGQGVAVEQLGQIRQLGVVHAGGVAGDGGAYAAGMDDAHADRMSGDAHLLAQRLGEPAHGELGRVVRALARRGEQAEHAGGVGDAAGAGGDEVREERLHAVHHAPEVDVDHAGDVLDVAALHGADEADARVVEQVVDHAV